MPVLETYESLKLDRAEHSETIVRLRCSLALAKSRHEESLRSSYEPGNLVSRAGLEPEHPQDKSQLIDSINRQKRSNRCFRRFEVHGGYTGYEFVSRQRGRQ